MESYFWFHKDAEYLSDALLAVMRTLNGPDYMRTKQREKSFDKRNHTVKAICQNMNNTYTPHTFNSILKFIEMVYKDGYTNVKYKYIRNERHDIMNAICIIEYRWIKYLYKNHSLDFSMDFENMRLY